MQREISREGYEELLKYKALYQNEKSHTQTLQAIINKLLQDKPIEVCTLCDNDIDIEDEIGMEDEEPTDVVIIVDNPTLPWTKEQKDDINRAAKDVAKTILSYLYED